MLQHSKTKRLKAKPQFKPSPMATKSSPGGLSQGVMTDNNGKLNVSNAAPKPFMSSESLTSNMPVQSIQQPQGKVRNPKRMNQLMNSLGVNQ